MIFTKRKNWENYLAIIYVEWKNDKSYLASDLQKVDAQMQFIYK